MGKDQIRGDATLLALRAFALRLGEVEEGLACKGTVVQSATLEVGSKAFLFLRPGRAMVKLDASRPEALKQAAKFPQRYKLGAGGWATVTWATPKEVSLPMLRRWIAESYALFAAD